MSTFTSSLGLEEIAPGTQAGLWGDSTNNNLNLIDQAVTGVTPLSFAGLSGTVRVLEASNGAEDEARSAVLDITGGATGANTVVVPNKQKTYLVRNDTGQNIVFRTATMVAEVVVPAANNTLIFCDGNNRVFPGIAVPGSGPALVTGGGTGQTTFTAGFIKSPGGTANLISSASVGLNSADVSGILPVANGGTGAASFTAGSLIIGNNTSNLGTLVGGSAGQVCTWNGSTWTAAASASAGVTSITGGTGISVNQATGNVTITNTSTVNTVNPTFSSSVTSPTYFVGNSSNSITQSGGEILFTANGATTAKVTNQGIGANAVICVGTTVGDQRVRCEGSGAAAGLSTGLAPSNIQIGASGVGIIYSGAFPRIEIALAGIRAFFDLSGSYQANNSANWATVSDVNIKTNLRPISSVLDKINALKPCHFEYKDKLGEVQTGFIAQEFATVFPGHTMDTPADDRYKGFLPEGETKLKAIDANLTAYLVKAIQELSAKVDAQAAEIAALKAQ